MATSSCEKPLEAVWRTNRHCALTNVGAPGRRDTGQCFQRKNEGGLLKEPTSKPLESVLCLVAVFQLSERSLQSSPVDVDSGLEIDVLPAQGSSFSKLNLLVAFLPGNV